MNNAKISKPKEIIRTTLGEFLSNVKSNYIGIYVVACYPALGCIYVGKTKRGVYMRLREHLGSSEGEFGQFLRSVMADACGFRLDILIPHINTNMDNWLSVTEEALIKKLKPLTNVMLI